jgi:hypothetical protein
MPSALVSRGGLVKPRRLINSLEAVIILLFIIVSSGAENQAQQDKSEQAIRDLEQRWLENEDDPNTLATILADDFVHALPMGFIGKQEQLNFLRKHHQISEHRERHRRQPRAARVMAKSHNRESSRSDPAPRVRPATSMQQRQPPPLAPSAHTLGLLWAGIPSSWVEAAPMPKGSGSAGGVHDARCEIWALLSHPATQAPSSTSKKTCDLFSR